MEINLTIQAIIFYSSKVWNFLFHKHCIHERKFLSKYNEITCLYIHLKSKGKLSKGSKSKISVTSIILHFIEVQGQSFKSKISVTSVTLRSKVNHSNQKFWWPLWHYTSLRSKVNHSNQKFRWPLNYSQGSKVKISVTSMNTVQSI